MDDHTLKRCYVCGESKPLSEFHRCRARRDGRQTYCKACTNLVSDRQRRKRGVPKRPERPPAPAGHKVCSKCGHTKPVGAFRKNRKGYLGRGSHCTDCRAAKERARRLANVEAYRERNRAYYRANREKVQAKNARWKAQNPKRALEIYREHYRANPEQYKERCARRRARKHASAGEFTEAEFQAKLSAYKHRCHWCREKIVGAAHRDHLIALTQGGSNDIGNIVPSCARCNKSKAARMPWEFNGRLL